MAVDPLTFDQSPTVPGVNFSSLANLGKLLQQQPTLADLGTAYGQPPTQPTAPGGTSASFSAPPTSGDVNKAIKATAAAAGMDVPTWKAIASIESSLNPASNSDRSTQYKGLFQIGSRGQGSEWATHGKGDIYNAMDNATAAASLAASNNAWFKDTYGRAPTPVETYMMHQQGRGFFANGTMTNVAGNPYPGMSGQQSPQSFQEGWGREIERRAKFFRGDNGD